MAESGEGVAGEGSSGGGGRNKKEGGKGVPLGIITAIMKEVVPEGTKIDIETKQCMQKCASEFIRFIASQAFHKKLHHNNPKSIETMDIINAIDTLSFHDYKYQLSFCLMSDEEEDSGDTPAEQAAEAAGDVEAAAAEEEEDRNMDDADDSGSGRD